jgi:leader peptidase (prepilin peptidase)/N-methyltransferase
MVAEALPVHPVRPGTRAIAGGCAAGALVAGLSAQRATSPLHFLLLAGFGLVLVALAAYDSSTMLLPNRIMFPALVVAVIAVGAWPDHSWLASLAGGLSGGGVMLALFLVVPGFGAGDVKLCTLIGLLCGWPHVLAALFVGLMVNGLIALVALASRRVGLRQAIPFGPGLIAGALIILLLGRA